MAAVRLETMMALTTMALVAAALISLQQLPAAEATPYTVQNCMMNRRFRVEDVSQCTYGWEVDACGNTLCTKGPGEWCGGKHMRYGICGEGLMCSNCNRCSGCSTKTYQCFDDKHCIW